MDKYQEELNKAILNSLLKRSGMPMPRNDNPGLTANKSMAPIVLNPVLFGGYMRPANNPLPQAQLTPLQQQILGPPKTGGGNYKLENFDTLPHEANLNPGPRHPNVGEPPFGSPNGPPMTQSMKYRDALWDQKIRAMGKDPTNMSPAEKFRLIHPGILD